MMQTRSTLEAELVELSARAAQLADHIERAAKLHDSVTVLDVLPLLQDVEREIDLVAFKLECVKECEESIPY